MKEVKCSKSYDSMELIAKTTTLRRLSDLVRPLQTLLQEKLTLKLVKKTDELLRRVGVGLLRNEAIQSRDLLIFCYEVIQEVYKVSSLTI
jgi:U3 small nucleolar RNA-associated protein 20